MARGDYDKLVAGACKPKRAAPKAKVSFVQDNTSVCRSTRPVRHGQVIETRSTQGATEARCLELRSAACSAQILPVARLIKLDLGVRAGPPHTHAADSRPRAVF